MIMKWLSSFLVVAIAAVVKAASFTGNRLLVVIEEQAEREKYSVFLEDLAGKCDFIDMEGIVSSRNDLRHCLHITKATEFVIVPESQAV